MRTGPGFALALLFLAGPCERPSDAPRPSSTYPAFDLSFRSNIVWLVAEDLSPLLLSFGDSTVQTPHLDRLADEGVLYTNVYSVSGVYAPSRYAIATGRYPGHDGAHHRRGGEAAAGPWTAYTEPVPLPAGRRLVCIAHRLGYRPSAVVVVE